MVVRVEPLEVALRVSSSCSLHVVVYVAHDDAILLTEVEREGG